jgi:hypothetical protein
MRQSRAGNTHRERASSHDSVISNRYGSEENSLVVDRYNGLEKGKRESIFKNVKNEMQDRQSETSSEPDDLAKNEDKVSALKYEK